MNMDLEILKIASENYNKKYIQNFTHRSKLKNPICGDEIQINLVIKDDKIIDFGYQGKSCIYCQASANILSKISINRNKSQIDKLCDNAKLYFEGNIKVIEKKWKILLKIFKNKNRSRKECILLPFKTMKKIVSE